MSRKTSETGMNQQLGDFGMMVTYIKGDEAKWKPGNDKLKSAFLTQQFNAASQAQRTVGSTLVAYRLEVNKRQGLFDVLDKTATDIGNAILLADTTPANEADVKILVDKILNRTKTKDEDEDDRAEEAAAQAGDDAADDNEEEDESDDNSVNDDVNEAERKFSLAQQGYQNLAQNFLTLTEMLTLIPEYQPEEEALKITALRGLHGQLDAANQDVGKAGAALFEARRERNMLFYGKADSLYHLMRKCKRYARILYGYGSETHKKFTALQVRKR